MSSDRKRLSFKNPNGFTLIEVMVTVAILAFGMVTVYEALFVCVDTYGYYTNYLNTQDWIDEKILEVQDLLMEKKEIEPGSTSGRFVRGHKSFDWTVTVGPVDEDLGLFRIVVELSWKQGSKEVQTSRAAYVMSPYLVEYNEANFV